MSAPIIRSKASVFIQGGPHNSYKGQTATTFVNDSDRYVIANTVKDADIVVWTGGEDINPIIYDEKPIKGTYYNSARDEDDLRVLDEAYGLSKFLVGICRGAQLLNVVPNGGSLWQDVDGHEGRNHSAFDCLTGKMIAVNSIHHQMMKITPKAELLCWSNESMVRKGFHDVWHCPAGPRQPNPKQQDKEPEAVWYPDTMSLLVQFHPEFGHPPTTKYFFSLMDRFFWKEGITSRA